MITRRNLLRASGVAFAIPFFESLARAQDRNASKPKRMVAIQMNLGLYAQNFFPTQIGRDYQPSRYLQMLEAHRDQFTVISGTSHPDVNGGHVAAKSFLTAAPFVQSSNFKNSISIDQIAAQHIGNETRYRYLPLSVFGRGISFSQTGAAIPPIEEPADVYAKLFLSDDEKEQAAHRQRLADGQSVMDTVLGKAKILRTRLSGEDRKKLDEYMNVVRETEQRMARQQQWSRKPKPTTEQPYPPRISQPDIVTKTRLMFDMMRLAIQTDSTRVISLAIGGESIGPLGQNPHSYHQLSHHGQDAEKIEQLTQLETGLVESFAGFLSALSETAETDGTMLDQTSVLFGSALGDGSSHNNNNLPILIAGGNFKHGQHLAFDKTQNAPTAKVFVSILQQLGIETDTFGTESGTIRGLEIP